MGIFGIVEGSRGLLSSTELGVCRGRPHVDTVFSDLGVLLICLVLPELTGRN